VLDLVYRPDETAWVHACRARGLRAEDGMRMLVEQGAEAFRVWFDVEPSLAAMWGALPPRGGAGG
jgi:shikimate dehydrogenase